MYLRRGNLLFCGDKVVEQLVQLCVHVCLTVCLDKFEVLSSIFE